jgi:Type III restriction enzyme, res subunit
MFPITNLTPIYSKASTVSTLDERTPPTAMPHLRSGRLSRAGYSEANEGSYQQIFSPTDFDFVISDEAHRSIGGNARAVFDYFIGYKLGLTATPRDYLKKFDRQNPTTKDPREYERRLLLDTYRTFGCEDSLCIYSLTAFFHRPQI